MINERASAGGAISVGLEVHRQLDTETKLFCGCPTRLSLKPPSIKFARRLRPTQSELGQVDPAAMFEFEKGRSIVYEADLETSCLVEMDEEPPHELNLEALEKALIVTHMVHAEPVDEIQVMRKVVIDGSNTAGFQRTCVVGLNGHIEVGGKKIGIQHVGLEEDAARKVAEDEKSVTYRLDRLGIPLLEVTTEPSISSPKEAEEAAAKIGSILRATGSVKRGLGSVRQDLNVSTKNGALTEIKGVQYLALIAKAVEYEAERQSRLIWLRDELKSRGITESQLVEEFADLTQIFTGTQSTFMRKALSEGSIYGVRLPRFAGLLQAPLSQGLRLGMEFAQRASFWGSVGGIIHTDELPGYGISMEEKRKAMEKFGCQNEDAVIIVAGSELNARNALKAVIERAKEAIAGVPGETRGINPDGSSRYLRPRPGASRMYPETDITPVTVSKGLLSRVSETKPVLPEELAKRLSREFALSSLQSRNLAESEFLPLFLKISATTKLTPSFIATTLTETLTSLQRQGVDVNNLTDDQMLGMFTVVNEGRTAKESIPELLVWMSKQLGSTPEEALKSTGLEMLTLKEIEDMIDEEIRANRDLVSMGDQGLSILMKRIMSQLRGKAEASKVQEILRAKLRS